MVAVPKMKMPDSCSVCPFEAAYFKPEFYTYCPHLEKRTAPMRIEERLDDCPLEEKKIPNVWPITVVWETSFGHEALGTGDLTEKVIAACKREATAELVDRLMEKDVVDFRVTGSPEPGFGKVKISVRAGMSYVEPEVT